MATEKQVNYVLYLADKKGLSTDYMGGKWKRFATMKQRQGTVRDFLASRTKEEISKIIDALKN